MKACVLTFPAFAGIGNPPSPNLQTIPGVLDQSGTPFLGRLGFFVGNSLLNTLDVDFRWSYGLDYPAGAQTRGTGGEDVFSFGGKIVCRGVSTQASVLSEHSQVFFGGAIYRLAKITAFRVGEFDLTYDLNFFTGDSISVVIIGGDDVLPQIGRVTGTPTGSIVTGFRPEGVIFLNDMNGNGTGGGSSTELGWKVRHGEQGLAVMEVINQGGNLRYQRTDECLGDSAGGGIVAEGTATLNPTGFDVSLSDTGSYTYLALGGIAAAAGVIRQPAVIGQQEIVTGLVNRLFLLLSIGAPPSGSPRSDMATWALGMTDGVRQAGYYTGEAVVGNGQPMLGSRYLADNQLIRWGTPNSSSTTFPMQAALVGFSVPHLSATIDWTAVDPSQPELLWLALGDAAVPTTECPAITMGHTGEFYSSFLVASGLVPPVVFAIIAGALPPGLTLDTATGEISGTPTTGGTFDFTFSVTDADATVLTQACAITILEVLPPGCVATVASPWIGR